MPSTIPVLLFRKCCIVFSVVEMVKKIQESAKQPVRQSHRTRTLNTRLGTPPKILLDMLKDHSSSMVKKSLPGIANVERIGRYNPLDVRQSLFRKNQLWFVFFFFRKTYQV